jgi:hypothetical protein
MRILTILKRLVDVVLGFGTRNMIASVPILAHFGRGFGVLE